MRDELGGAMTVGKPSCAPVVRPNLNQTNRSGPVRCMKSVDPQYDLAAESE